MNSFEKQDPELGSKEKLLSQIRSAILSLSHCLGRIQSPDAYSGDFKERQNQAIASLLESQSLLLDSFQIVALVTWKSRKD